MNKKSVGKLNTLDDAKLVHLCRKQKNLCLQKGLLYSADVKATQNKKPV